MCWGRTSIQEGRRMSLFCLTEKREIIQIVEGESELKIVNEIGEGVTAFDEVFDVDKVEERASALKKGSDYGRLINEMIICRRCDKIKRVLCSIEWSNTYASTSFYSIPILI